MANLPLQQLLVFIIIHDIFLCIVYAYAKNETTDVQALLEFKSKITSDPLHVLRSWNESIPLCQWYGVTCGRRHKRVQQLCLNSSQITGTISPYVGNLSFLTYLNLQSNSFVGTIPLEISHLQRLRFLWLGDNSLTGTIPFNISNCYNLNSVNLHANLLVGVIPADLSYLRDLVFLSLGGNSLVGPIPYSFGNLSTLGVLHLAENQLIGVLPETLGQLNSLTWLDVRLNILSRSVPTSICNLSSLFTFDISENMIHGSLPPYLFNTLPNLFYFTIGENQMKGSIPISLSNASSLVWFDNGENEFTGKLPTLENLYELTRFRIAFNHHGSGGIDDLDFLCDIARNTKLEFLDIGQNNLGGTLPVCIGNMSSVARLVMDGNSISGLIPAEIGNLVNLQVLTLKANQLSGEIPSSIGNLGKLVALGLGNNKLSGNIPSSLGYLQELTHLSLGDNKFQGEIPHTLGLCQRLNFLYLYANNLSGSIPIEIFHIVSLIEMSVFQNRLQNSLPEVVEKLENLNVLDVSENMLSQLIPISLGKCNKLEELHLQGNFFEGMIPPSLGLLRGVNVIDLSRNNLTGQIPRSLVDLMFLENLNLSHNNLEGPVPKDGVFKNVSRFTIIANNKLCGGIPQLKLPKCNLEILHNKVSGNKASHITIKVALGVLSGLLGILCSIFSLLFYWVMKRSTAPQGSISDHLLRLSYQSLLKATNGFSSSNKLGSGSFGSVYKGILDMTRTTIAIKVFDLHRHSASRSFLAECEVLKRIRHRNLVKILTACSGLDSDGNEFKALVYEYMANGSLEDWLHPVPTKEGTDQVQKHLGFLLRLNIAIDVACALEYLHNQYEVPIIHHDVKPKNILLNNEMIGHVGDFGLSKILLDTSNNNTKSQTSSIGFKGTIGYIPPEYGTGTSVSTQGDVYSYGVLLLELFTGKRPNDDIFCGSISINCFVKAALPDEVAKIVDPALHVEMDNLLNEGKTVLEYLFAIFQIGVSCSANLPGERKSMKEVVANLKTIRNVFLHN